jgi:hypothetical protein
MGNYNPHIPFILGQEWAPIRDENTVFSPSVNAVELGHGLTVTASRRLQDARFYVNEMPPLTDRGQTYLAAVYRRGTEGLSGPVRREVIPANLVAMTGGTVSGAATAVQALLTQSTSSGISLNTSLANAGLVINFAVGQYPNLTAKRILGVNILIGGSGTSDIFGAGSSSASAVYMAQNAAVIPVTPFALFGRLGDNLEIDRNKTGEINQFWNSPTTPTSSSTRMPWNYLNLLRLDILAPIIYTIITTGTSVNTGTIAGSSSCYIFYVALEIFYCEEQRIAYGAEQFGTTFSSSSFGKDTILGANTIPLLDVAQFAAGSNAQPSLAVGEYTVTLSSADVGALNGNTTVTTSDFSNLNAVRELYALPDHPGTQLDIPSPMDLTAVGSTFEKLDTHVLTQLTLHTSGGPVPEVHVYGRQARAQVYGTITATQEIFDTGLSALSYPQVRYYARRFGNTTVPLTLSSPTLSGSGQNVSITPDDFDGLDEIVDGWKEITLRFPTAPSMGAGTNPQWVWSAATEVAGNRWEVLGAIAPALSGTPAGLYTLVPPPQQLSSATYGQPTVGATVNMGWVPGYAPPVTATTDDQTTDATLIFSTDPAPVSGFGVTVLSQALTGIGLDCGLPPEFIPTALSYNQLAWTLDQVNQMSDLFTRVVASGWGTATSGQAWTASGGSASDYSVNGSTGNILLSTTNVYRLTRAATFSVRDVNGYVEISSDTAASGADHWGSLFLRDNGSGDQLYGEINFAIDGSVKLILTSVVSAVHTVLGTVTFAGRYIPGTKVKLRLLAFGSAFKGKAWLDGDVEPADWLIQVATTANGVAGLVGTRSIAGPGSPTTITVSYDNLLVSNYDLGYTEIQRMDTVDATWKTIMKATNQAQMSFNDYEARVGILASYRVRKVNLYEFAGSWSSTITATIPAPGVTATSTNATSHVWIFTTNSIQNGSSNLAYCLGWDGEVSEDFNFPEAAGQVFQVMYDRDFVVAFRPSERGGTNFSRNLLVQAAAISPETLEDFTSLRNMAWVDVPFICLRDEAGNRWFANVSVPGGTVLNSRRLYMAPVTIVEVTDTPTPVSP